MRCLLVSLIAILAGQSFDCSASPNLEGTGLPLRNPDIRIEWLASSNRIPRELMVFKVLPAEFSEAFVKKVVALCEFSNSAVVLGKLKPSFQGQDAWFQGADNKYVSFSPSKGRVYFTNDRAIPLPGAVIEGVPSDEEVLKRALIILLEFGVKESELRRKPDTNELFVLHDVRHLGQRNKETGKLERKVIARGVWLSRAVNEIGLAGQGVSGGIRVVFGNQGQIAEIEFVWRRLVERKPVRCADAKEILQVIRNGKAFVQNVENPALIKSLRIVDATVYYLGEDSLREQREMYPFISLKAEATFAGKTTEVFVNCPLILE